MKRRTVVAVIAALMLLAGAIPAQAHRRSGHDRENRRQIIQLYRATAKYHRVSNVIADGFVPFTINEGEEITCFDDPNAGGMGVHYVNHIGDGAVSPLQPEAMVYEVTRTGRLRLVAVEYVVLQSEVTEPPELFGQTFTPKVFDTPDGPLAIYKLHVWIWKWNPSGLFADFNPRVRDCA